MKGIHSNTTAGEYIELFKHQLAQMPDGELKEAMTENITYFIQEIEFLNTCLQLDTNDVFKKRASDRSAEPGE